MKIVKITLIAAEICCLAGVALLAFNAPECKDEEFFSSIYIVLLSVTAVVLQKEQQDIEL